MKLAEAMKREHEAAQETGPKFRVFFACGFTPQHAKTFLAAHLATGMPGRHM